MIKLNLKAESPEFQAIKEFLEENANEFLAEKINNGVFIQKDGKRLLNKKDLASFMKYAYEEARKLSAKGTTSACVKDEIVFGWAMHYFEENDLIGKLYNEDGSEYKPAPKKTNKNVQPVPAPTVQTKPTPPKPRQFNLFDMMSQTEDVKTDKPTEEKIENNNDGEFQTPAHEDIDDGVDEPVEDEIIEMNVTEDTQNPCTWKVNKTTGEILSKSPVDKKGVPLQASPLYQKYMRFQNQYPHAVIAYRLGDFFEVFGDNAVKLANNFNLTLTGRDCGLEERVPMVGFPYHASGVYFHKISERFELVVVEDNVATPYGYDDDKTDPYAPIEEENESTVYENKDKPDDDLEELRASTKAFEQTALCALLEIFGEEIMIPEEDY